MKLNFEKNGGFVIAVAQDADTGQVLMVAHANEIAVRASIQSRKATFWSKSRNALWCKGETSGDTLEIVEIWADCDRDAILYLVRPRGSGACHIVGWKSCFGFQILGTKVWKKPNQSPSWGPLWEEEQMICGRQNADPNASHTAASIQKPIDRVAQKIAEEGLEVALAMAAKLGRKKIVSETADLLYRLQIGLVKCGISWKAIEAEIKKRRK